MPNERGQDAPAVFSSSSSLLLSLDELLLLLLPALASSRSACTTASLSLGRTSFSTSLDDSLSDDESESESDEDDDEDDELSTVMAPLASGVDAAFLASLRGARECSSAVCAWMLRLEPAPCGEDGSSLLPAPRDAARPPRTGAWSEGEDSLLLAHLDPSPHEPDELRPRELVLARAPVGLLARERQLRLDAGRGGPGLLVELLDEGGGRLGERVGAEEREDVEVRLWRRRGSASCGAWGQAG